MIFRGRSKLGSFTFNILGFFLIFLALDIFANIPSASFLHISTTFLGLISFWFCLNYILSSIFLRNILSILFCVFFLSFFCIMHLNFFVTCVFFLSFFCIMHLNFFLTCIFFLSLFCIMHLNFFLTLSFFRSIFFQFFLVLL
ncbi:hypothetical protein CFOL_v3_24932 [Cephalotus follicularis]|uniref:Uncharacterized protein n=1 Tax=Cephalotus follicularis TaxID=3775 RepID=A0A1Q3CMK6_CEPFO|nr:hypothetical protein CFOL_v3_24932 [Cephalotus follicularis]